MDRCVVLFLRPWSDQAKSDNLMTLKSGPDLANIDEEGGSHPFKANAVEVNCVEDKSKAVEMPIKSSASDELTPIEERLSCVLWTAG